VGGKLPVLRYQSKRTGLTVTIGKAESPIVNGYFCLATEAHTEDGLPHMLEHLVFLGRQVMRKIFAAHQLCCPLHLCYRCPTNCL
jgi:Zn-dependent M16 (insulinase) family peptidase